jgi:hypothetical protein
MGFGGALLFTVEFDDFIGTCGCEKFPILNAVNRQFGRGRRGTPDQECKFF